MKVLGTEDDPQGDPDVRDSSLRTVEPVVSSWFDPRAPRDDTL